MTDNTTRNSPPGSTFGPFVRGLVCAIAVGAMASSSGSDNTSAATLAFGIGVVAAVVGLAEFLSGAAGFFYSAVGVVALIQTVIDFVSGANCSDVMPVGLRYAAVALLVVLVGVAIFASVTARGWPSSAVGLGLYGAAEILFAAGMFISDAESSWIALAVMVVAAPVLGWFVVRSVDWVTGVAAVPLSLYAIYGASWGGNCEAQNFSGAVLLVVFCVTYFVTQKVARLFVGRR